MPCRRWFGNMEDNKNGPGARAMLKHKAHLSAAQASEGVTVRRSLNPLDAVGQ